MNEVDYIPRKRESLDRSFSEQSRRCGQTRFSWRPSHDRDNLMVGWSSRSSVVCPCFLFVLITHGSKVGRAAQAIFSFNVWFDAFISWHFISSEYHLWHL